MEFRGEPILQPTDDGYHWVVQDDYVLEDDVLGIVTVKKGFESDLGSIPRMFWDVIPPIGAPLRAYLVHDWLYAQQTCDRQDADDCLMRMMIILNVGIIERETIYHAVRIGGQAAWDKDAAKKGAP